MPWLPFIDPLLWLGVVGLLAVATVAYVAIDCCLANSFLVCIKPKSSQKSTHNHVHIWKWNNFELPYYNYADSKTKNLHGLNNLEIKKHNLQYFTIVQSKAWPFNDTIEMPELSSYLQIFLIWGQVLSSQEKAWPIRKKNYPTRRSQTWST